MTTQTTAQTNQPLQVGPAAAPLPRPGVAQPGSTAADPETAKKTPRRLASTRGREEISTKEYPMSTTQPTIRPGDWIRFQEIDRGTLTTFEGRATPNPDYPNWLWLDGSGHIVAQSDGEPVGSIAHLLPAFIADIRHQLTRKDLP